MELINVYSKALISHQFPIVLNGEQKNYVIHGTNSLGVLTGNVLVPKITEMEENVFDAIKEKYKDNVFLFGGTLNGAKVEPQIYKAATKQDAAKIMRDTKPVVTDAQMATKTKDVTVYKK